MARLKYDEVRKEIEENNYDLSINRYKENHYEEVEYEDPNIILKKIDNLENEIIQGINQLKDKTSNDR